MKIRVHSIVSFVGFVMALSTVNGSQRSADSKTTAIVSDEVVFAAHNNPPIRNHNSYRLVAIDGHSIKRERLSSFSDSKPGVVVESGSHVFKVLVAAVARPAGCVAKETSFRATVEAGKRYIISSKAGQPMLVEEKPSANNSTDGMPGGDAPGKSDRN